MIIHTTKENKAICGQPQGEFSNGHIFTDDKEKATCLNCIDSDIEVVNVLGVMMGDK